MKEKTKISSLGVLLRKSRENNGLGLQELATEIGCSASYIWKIEREKVKNPSAATIFRLASVFNWSMDILKEVYVSQEEERMKEQIKSLEGQLPKDMEKLKVLAQKTFKGRKRYLEFLQALIEEEEARGPA